MVQQTNISFKEKLWFSDGFQLDKKERKLSKVINLLLNAHYSIETEEKDQKTLTQVEEELLKINAEKAELIKKAEYLKKKNEEEKNRYIIME